MDLLPVVEPFDKVYVTTSTYRIILAQRGLDRKLIYHSQQCQAYHDAKPRMMQIEFAWLGQQPNFQERFRLCLLCANPNLDNAYSQGRYAAEHAEWLEDEKENAKREVEELRDIISDYEELTKKRPPNSFLRRPTQ